MSQQRNSSINIRALESQRALIDKAAACRQVTRTEFILESACRAAENVLLDQRLFIQDDASYKAFINLLESPVDDNLKLKSLLNSRSPWEK